MIYLNNVTNGGTYFDNYNLTLNAVEGRLLIWPAFWTHFHRGVVAPNERKYIITGWASDFEEYKKKYPTELRLSLSSANHKILT